MEETENGRNLESLFSPSSVAVVGASPESWYSSQLVDNLLDYGYDGDLYLVNPSRDEAWNRPCYDA
ncbi:MAG: CoA-binding protein, partial [Halobacteria archaeon]|nr:CoA-binding protein [Halobacteria archaeon]